MSTTQTGAGNVNGAETNKKKGIGPKLVGICVAVVAVLAVIFFATSKPTINLNKYLEVEFEGYDGYGQAKAKIDWDAIEDKYGKKLKLSKDAGKDKSPIKVLRAGVKVSFDNNGQYENGDKASYTWTIAEDLGEKLNCKIKYTDGSEKVSDLTEVTTFDPFEDLEVSFEGVSPDGKVTLNYTGETLSQGDFKLAGDQVIKNGEKVTVTLVKTEIDHYLDKYGMIPETTEKEYEVSGLDEMITSYAELTDDEIAELNKQTEEQVNKAYKSSKDSIDKIEDAGYIFISPDLDNGGKGDNSLYLIKKITLTNDKTIYIFNGMWFSRLVRGTEGLSYDPVECMYFDKMEYTTLDPNEDKLFAIYKKITGKHAKNAVIIECSDNLKAFQDSQVVSSFSDIPEKALEEDAMAIAKSFAENEYECEIVSTEVIGQALATLDDENLYYVVVGVKVKGMSGVEDNSIAYCPVCYSGLVKLPDGSVTSSKKGFVTGCSEEHDLYTGFFYGSEMYDWFVDKHSGYNLELSDGIEKCKDN